VALAESLAQAVAASDATSVILDGELLGDGFVAFDILEFRPCSSFPRFSCFVPTTQFSGGISFGQTVVNAEASEVCATCQGEGNMPSEGGVRAVCDACGGRLGAIANLTAAIGDDDLTQDLALEPRCFRGSAHPVDLYDKRRRKMPHFELRVIHGSNPCAVASPSSPRKQLREPIRD
jgi:hypothetical protein